MAETSRGYLTFPDGDIVWKSSDGIEFRIHSIILRLASSFFSAMLELPQSTLVDHNEVAEPLRMDETATVLDDTLRSIYPPFLAPKIGSNEHAIALWRVADKFQIMSKPLCDAVDAYLECLEPPLNAWRLSLQLGHVSMRNHAVRRFLAQQGDLLDVLSGNAEELRGADAADLIRLLQLKRDIIRLGGRPAETLLRWSSCSPHLRREIIPSLLLQPFLHPSLVETEEHMLIAAERPSSCKQCQKCWLDTEGRQVRKWSRDYLEQLLQSATDIESKRNRAHLPEPPKELVSYLVEHAYKTTNLHFTYRNRTSSSPFADNHGVPVACSQDLARANKNSPSSDLASFAQIVLIKEYALIYFAYVGNSQTEPQC